MGVGRTGVFQAIRIRVVLNATTVFPIPVKQYHYRERQSTFRGSPFQLEGKESKMIYSVLSKSDFVDEFMKSERREQFSQEALEILYDYYDELDEDVEFDIIDICCSWSEYSSKVALWVDFRSCEYTDEGFDELREELDWVIEIPNGGYLNMNM